VYRPAIGRPRVLLVVSHPTVGSGIETILRLERRYEVRRTSRLWEAVAAAQSWPADLALVDALLLRGDTRADLGIPTLVLAASADEAAAAQRTQDRPRGWVATDAPSAELVSAVERLLTRPMDRPAGPVALLGIGVLLVVLVGLILYLTWIAIA
jgi:DNA-binding NarL/FixJ family response regulator